MNSLIIKNNIPLLNVSIQNKKESETFYRGMYYVCLTFHQTICVIDDFLLPRPRICSRV